MEVTELIPRPWRMPAAAVGLVTLWSALLFYWLSGLAGLELLILAGFAFAWTASFVAVWRSRRIRHRAELFSSGICPRCKYDLRGSRGVRCPECSYWHGRRFESRA